MAGTRTDGDGEVTATRATVWAGFEDEITGSRASRDTTLALGGGIAVVSIERSKELFWREDVAVDFVGQALSAGGQKLGHHLGLGRVCQRAPSQHGIRYAIDVVVGDKDSVGDERRREEPTGVNEGSFATKAPHGHRSKAGQRAHRVLEQCDGMGREKVEPSTR